MSGGLHWHWDAETVGPMLAFSAAYAVGVGRLWCSAGAGRGIGYGEVAALVAGIVLLGIAVLSPLAALADQLFSAHMVVHEIIMAVAAPLIVMGRPWGAIAWAFPARLPLLPRVVALLTGGLVATLLQAAVIWIWHVPAYFHAATGDTLLHGLQHLSFLGAALLFWQAMERLSGRWAGAAVVWLFATSMHTGLLGALLLVAPRLWFPAQGGFGLSPLEDQQLGGAIMWVPGGLIYAAAALFVAGRWIAARGNPSHRAAGAVGWAHELRVLRYGGDRPQARP